MNASDFSEGEIDALTHGGLLALSYSEEDIAAFKAQGEQWKNPRISAQRILGGEDPGSSAAFTDYVRREGAAIVARRAAPVTPAREKLAPWVPSGTSGWQARCRRSDGAECVHLLPHDRAGSFWRVFIHDSGQTMANGTEPTREAAMSAADLAARDIYDLDELPSPAQEYAAAIRRASQAADYIRPPLTPAVHTGRPIYTGDCCADCTCNHGSSTRRLTEKHCVCRDDGHRWRPAVEWSKPADNARPHTTVRDGLDALLRFVLGNPNGERWLGAASWRAICAHGNDYRRDRGVPYRDPEVRDLATRLLDCLSLIPGPSTQRWLTIPEARKYERLRVELRRAMGDS